VSNLPFLKKQKQSSGVSMEYRKPDEAFEPDDGDSSDAPLESAAEDLIRCVSAGDKKGAARAIRSAFEILDSEPHEEIEDEKEEQEDD